MKRNINDYIHSKKIQFGDKFDASGLHEHFHKYFNSGERVKVRFKYGETFEEVTGTIGVTTGWKPAFLLMRRSNSMGSSDLLGANDRVIAVRVGRKYV